MCIIVAKPNGVKFPSNESLRSCFDNNPDGAGIMIAADGKIIGTKGLMTFDAVLGRIAELEKTYGNLDDFSVVLHFRVGTHGSINPENTHPFPLNREAITSYNPFRILDWEAEQAFCHNGVLYSYGEDPDAKKYDVSDTVIFGKKILAPLADLEDIATSSFCIDSIKLVLGYGWSKFTFMNGHGDIALVGSFEESNGVFYSNYGYKPIIRHSKTSYAYTYDPDDYSDSWAKTNSSRYEGYKSRRRKRWPYQEEDDDLPFAKEDTSTESDIEPSYYPSTAFNGDIEITTAQKTSAKSLGIEILDRTAIVLSPDINYNGCVLSRGDGINNLYGILYEYNYDDGTWDFVAWTKEMALIDYSSGRFLYNSWKTPIPVSELAKYGLIDVDDLPA